MQEPSFCRYVRDGKHTEHQVRSSNITIAKASSYVKQTRALLLRLDCADAFFLRQSGLPSTHLCITPRARAE